MTPSLAAAFLLFLAGVGAGLAQLWFRVWDPDTFVKIMITDVALFVVVLAWRVVARERRETQRIRNPEKLG